MMMEGPLYSEQTVYFGTNRNRTSTNKPDEMFGNEESEQGLHLGACVVSIPHDHEAGEMEAPRWWRFEFTEDPEKHIVLLSTNPLKPDTFYRTVHNRVQKSEKQKLFVFIHGYLTTFRDAARRTAQMAHDLNFSGAPVFFSWPSKGKVTAYAVDETTNERSRPALKEFLLTLIEKAEAKEIYLVAHSMGTRALTGIFSELYSELAPGARPRIKEVILAAPDIDRKVFETQIAPRMVETKVPVTIYASAEDLALAASKQFHGYPRLGDSAELAATIDGIEAIDASGVSTEFLNHALFAEQPTIIRDILELVDLRLRADKRSSVQPVPAVNRYWRVVPEKSFLP
jgi:esterase/lipase superfamily enzyme